MLTFYFPFSISLMCLHKRFCIPFCPFSLVFLRRFTSIFDGIVFLSKYRQFKKTSDILECFKLFNTGEGRGFYLVS